VFLIVDKNMLQGSYDNLATKSELIRRVQTLRLPQLTHRPQALELKDYSIGSVLVYSFCFLKYSAKDMILLFLAVLG